MYNLEKDDKPITKIAFLAKQLECKQVILFMIKAICLQHNFI